MGHDLARAPGAGIRDHLFPVVLVSPYEDAVKGALDFLGFRDGNRGIPSAWLALDPFFDDIIVCGKARGLLHQRFDTDIGFDLGDEAFSAMISLTLLPPATGTQVSSMVGSLARQVESARWWHRFRFFPGVREFAADTDCTAIATGALYEHGLISKRQLLLGAQEILQSAAPSGKHAEAGPADNDRAVPDVFTVYWDDGSEPDAPPRGRKHDAVACANALYTVHLAKGHVGSSVDATLQYISDHLTSRLYLAGTRYYPSPEAFLHAASRLCTRCAICARKLVDPLRRALADLETMPHAEREGQDSGPLGLALRIITADHLGVRADQREGHERLVSWQQPDGSWPAQAYYRMGRFPLYFGSPHLTTFFALRALRKSRGRER
ncbi:hypothetical protein AB0I10_17985 [Streptomyces sp. NPDC050636]|uniref:hypothetical protein n=1 Tax=Streptomyces sp. NPDC050636 TaxID=3154510 RepID=UPI003421491F